MYSEAGIVHISSQVLCL